MTKQREFDVVGLRHRLTPDQARTLDDMLPLRVTVEREPKNPADPNALAVRISDDASRLKGVKIGYLRAIVANELAPAMDEGRFQIHGGWLNIIAFTDGVGSMTLETETRKKARS